jgi:hypothetical protein
MTTQVTVTLRDDVYNNAEQLAQSTGRDVADVVAAMFQASFPVVAPLELSKPVEELTNQEVLTLADSRMDTTQNIRMSTLLEKQQNDHLDAVEQYELSMLLYVYQEGSLLKAKALVEAVNRGLRTPPIR